MSDVLLKIDPVLVQRMGTTIDIQVYSPPWKLDRTQGVGFDRIVAQLPKGVQALFMPRPTKSNMIIAQKDDFKLEVEVGAIPVYGKIDADGAIIRKGDAFAILSADCPTVVMWIEGFPYVICAHAGRDSVLPKGRNDTVIAHMRNAFRTLDVSDATFHAWARVYVCAGIRTGFTHPLNDPQYSERNQELHRRAKKYKAVINWHTGEIDLYGVIRQQAIDCGVHAMYVRCDDLNTYTDPRLASNRRNPGERNLVIVHYR